MENETFSTDDITIASYLLAKGANLIETSMSDSRHAFFIFQDLYKCQDLKREYLNGGQAPARELFSRRLELLSEIKNRKGNGDQYGDRNY